MRVSLVNMAQSKYGRTYGKLKSMMSTVKCSDQQGRLVEQQDQNFETTR